MSNYRRLISYIYAYEGDVKGKNIGFAKLETRNGQCKISVNVKKVYVGGNDMGVYLLSNGEEILLGTMFIRNGAGEFRTIVQANNIDGSGYEMDQCYGLTIHDVKDSWQSYATIWEDAVAYAAEVELKENKQKPELVQDYEPIIKEIEKEVAAQEELKELESNKFDENESENQETAENQEQQEIQVDHIEPETFVEEQLKSADEVVESMGYVDAVLMERELEEELEELKEETEESFETEMDITSEISEQQEIEPVVEVIDEPIVIGDQEELERLLKEEENNRPRDTWQSFRKAYPKIQAFDYEKGCEIITIKPQDIGMLPREIWVYGNNSFLLHGYYNYRYLILAKLENPDGMPRYLLGVPGHYYSNEKYMASMFGFPNFVLSKQQPVGDGRFGYWYTDIKLSN